MLICLCMRNACRLQSEHLAWTLHAVVRPATLALISAACPSPQVLSNSSVSSGVGVYWMFYSGGDFEAIAAPQGLPGLAAGQEYEGVRMRAGLAMSQVHCCLVALAVPHSPVCTSELSPCLVPGTITLALLQEDLDLVSAVSLQHTGCCCASHDVCLVSQSSVPVCVGCAA